MAKALVAVSGLRGEQNFEIVGIGVGGNRSKLEDFVRDQGLKFQVIDDESGAIAQKLSLQIPVAIIGADAEGYVTFGLGGFPSDLPNAPQVVETQLRSALRLEPVVAQTLPELGQHPKAPDFAAERLEGGERFQLAALRGKPVLDGQGREPAVLEPERDALVDEPFDDGQRTFGHPRRDRSLTFRVSRAVGESVGAGEHRSPPARKGPPARANDHGSNGVDPQAYGGGGVPGNKTVPQGDPRPEAVSPWVSPHRRPFASGRRPAEGSPWGDPSGR